MANDNPKESLLFRFFRNRLEDLKDIGRGVALLPAHLVNNPADTILKATTVGLASIPVVGSVVTALYVAKRTYQNTGPSKLTAAAAAVALGFWAGVVSTIPGVGSAIVGSYALHNISKQNNDIPQAYRQAGTGLVEAAKSVRKTVTLENLKSLGKAQTWKQGVATAAEKVQSVGIKGIAQKLVSFAKTSWGESYYRKPQEVESKEVGGAVGGGSAPNSSRRSSKPSRPLSPAPTPSTPVTSIPGQGRG